MLGAAGVAATAGCSDRLGAGTGTNEPARYSDLLAAESVDDEGVGIFSFDWSGLNELQGTETPAGTETPTEGTETPTPGGGGPTGSDPLATYPIGVLVATAIGVGFGAGFLGLGALVEFDGPTERLHFVDGGFVFEGEYDPADVGESLEGAGGREVTEYEGVPLYEAGSGDNQATVAVSEELVVLVFGGDGVDDTTAVARRVLDSEADRIERYRDTEADFERLVSAFESGLIQSALYVPEGDFREEATDEEEDPGSAAGEIDLEGQIVGASSSARLSESEYVSELALLFADSDEVPTETDVEAELGTAAAERAVTIDGRLVVVSGTYRDTPSNDDAPLA